MFAIKNIMKKLLENIITIQNTDTHKNIKICNFIKFNFLRNTNTRKIKYKKLIKKLYKKRNLLKLLSFFVPCKKYRYIIPFGQNCDFSKSFLDYFKYNDSTLFNWCATGYSIVQQFNVLENPQILFSEEYYYKNLWTCKKTQLSFHGRSEKSELQNEDGTYNEQLLEADLQELKSRITYLAHKTTKYLKTRDKKLIVYSVLCYKKDDEAKQASNAIELYENLKNRNIKNFDLLVICARQNYSNINKIIKSKYPQIFVRYVKSNYDIPHRLYKDIIGWAKIFLEFRPEKIDKSKYKVLKDFKKA